MPSLETSTALLPDVPRDTMPVSCAGVPGLSVPCGFADGMPVWVHLLGRPHDEAALLRLAICYQQVTSRHLVRPAVLDALPA